MCKSDTSIGQFSAAFRIVEVFSDLSVCLLFLQRTVVYRVSVFFRTCVLCVFSTCPPLFLYISLYRGVHSFLGDQSYLHSSAVLVWISSLKQNTCAKEWVLLHFMCTWERENGCRRKEVAHTEQARNARDQESVLRISHDLCSELEAAWKHETTWRWPHDLGVQLTSLSKLHWSDHVPERNPSPEDCCDGFCDCDRELLRQMSCF